MLSIEDVNRILDQVAETIPQELFRELNGGVSLLPQSKTHSEDTEHLYVLGEYHRDMMGRYIYIYYNSLMAVYPHATEESIRPRLRKLLLHELTHHMESLAGLRDLEEKDALYLARFKDRGQEVDR